MQSKKRLEKLKKEFFEAWEKLKIDDDLKQLEMLENEVADPEIWKNPDTAREKNETLARLKEKLEAWQMLKMQITDIAELLDLGEDDLAEEIDVQISAMETTFAELKQTLKFTGPYDHNNAIIRITAGAGGTEAMDWAGMLERMYLRFFEKKGYKATLL